IESGHGIIIVIHYKATNTGRSTAENAEKAAKMAFPQADILKKKGIESRVICSVTLTSIGGKKCDYRVWAKDQDIQNHYTSTLQSEQREIITNLREAAEAAHRVMETEENDQIQLHQ
ncbi:MAG: hypothetical protein EZS28_019283, partial [Streblomastix strix]